MGRAGIVYLTGKDESQHELLAISRWHCVRHHPEIDQLVISGRSLASGERAADDWQASLASGKTTTVVIDDSSDPATNASLKPQLNDITPFDSSLFLGHDTVVTARLDRIWHSLDENPLAVAVDFRSRMAEALAAAVQEKSITPQEADATQMLCGPDGLFFSTRVVLWKRCLASDRFFEIWNREQRRFPGRDDFAFARALAKTGMRIAILPSRYNVPVLTKTTEEEIRRASILHFRTEPKTDHVRRLGFFPTGSPHEAKSAGNVSPVPEDPAKRRRLCVICRDRNASSESAVRAHIEHLPARVSVFSGVWYPHPPDLPPQLARFLIESRADAVLAEAGPVGVAAMDVCERLGLPLIVHFHGADAYHRGMVEPLQRHYERLFQAAEAIVAPSEMMCQRLRELKAPPSKVHHNPYGVDASLFECAQPADNPPVFVTLGRFVDTEAPHLTVLAFRDVVKQCPEARLAMVGEGPLLESCRELVSAYGMTSCVDFPGAGSPPTVAATLSSARAFVHHSVETSYGDSEGTPAAVLEAGAAGLPIVASRLAGIQDIVVDGETGFLVDEGGVPAMTERMLQLAQDTGLAASMGAAARERITSQFSMDASIEGLWRIIYSCLHTRAAAG